MNLVEGPVAVVGIRNDHRDKGVYLRPVQTVTTGALFGRPNNVCFRRGRNIVNHSVNLVIIEPHFGGYDLAC
jgi:hypothetical protein